MENPLEAMASRRPGSARADACFCANEHFHQAICHAGHNSFLAEQGVARQRNVRPCRCLQLRVRNRVSRSFEEHQDIL
jgi:DNA-binding GntR family transcriptional regulator